MDVNLDSVLESLNKIDNDLFCTFSTFSKYHVNIREGKVYFSTGGRERNVELDTLIDLIFDVYTLRSFYYEDYRRDYANAAYLIPVAYYVLNDLGVELLKFEPPTKGWDKVIFEVENIHSQIDACMFDAEDTADVYHKSAAKLFDADYAKNSLAYGTPNISPTKLITQRNETLVDVHYSTNREYDESAKEYTSVKCNKNRYGVACVSVPETHRSGNIEKPKWWKLELTEKRGKHFVVVETTEQKPDIFFSSLKTKNESKRVLVFIHGFNVSFNEGLKKAAQIKYDLGVDFPVVLYSWPSLGKVSGYIKDKETALYSSNYLHEFITKLNAEGYEEVLYIAHSMGNLCLSEAVNQGFNQSVPSSRAILAAADVERQTFLDRYAESINSFFNHVSLYVSSRDRALLVSKKANKEIRVGDSTDNSVFVCDHSETIDISDNDGGFWSLKHSYISETNVVLNDVYFNLIKGLKASERRLLELQNRKNQIYWKFHEA
ncbi:alpha/beta hydrolase [Neptuniibacter sp. QD72_48]|uniref:alpha/beta hydrolase n=1 Tax=Neptuniibacter sp. QD72_48 TaxID=3398214 RepID=UPI0039F6140E